MLGFKKTFLSLVFVVISIIIIVRTQFVTNRNSVGFARKKTPTMSFVERGFERLGPDHQVMGFSRCSYKVK